MVNKKFEEKLGLISNDFSRKTKAQNLKFKYIRELAFRRFLEKKRMEMKLSGITERCVES